MDNRTETLLELYFANALSEADAVVLRNLLDNDPEAAAEFNWRQQIAQATRHLQLARPELQKKQPLKIMIWSSLAVAAALAAWAVATIFMPGTPSVPEAVASHFEHYPNRMSFKALDPTAAADVPAEVIRAFQLYDDTTQYQAAADALGTIAAKYPEHPEYGLYQGVALLGVRDYPLAITALQKAADTQGSWRVPALYYLGLAQSGAQQYQKARQSFQSYLNDKDGIPYRKQATEMLKILPGE